MEDMFDRINNLLEERGLSRRKLAQKASIPPTTLNSAFSRHSGLSAESVAAIAEVLQTTTEFLVGIGATKTFPEKTATFKQNELFDRMPTSKLELKDATFGQHINKESFVSTDYSSMLLEYLLLLDKYNLSHSEFQAYIDQAEKLLKLSEKNTLEDE